MAIIENIGALIVLIGVMIVIHELGHYWAARAFDVRVESFSVGFGPRLFGFRKGETDFKISLIPLGGFVKMAGEQPGDSNVDDPRSFTSKPRWQRLIIAFAGPAMNIVLAVALLTGVFMVQYPKVMNADGPATIGHITENSPAAESGFQEGDRIVKIDGQENPTWEDVLMKEIGGAGQKLAVSVERAGAGGTKRDLLFVTPKLDEKLGVGIAGWSEQSEMLIDSLSPGMAAEKAGLQKGDVIVSVNGTVIRSIGKLHQIIGSSEGKPVEIFYARDGERNKVVVTPAFTKDDTPQGRYMIGVRLAPRVVMSQLSFPDALRESSKQNFRSAGLIFTFLRGIVEQRMSAKSLEGPIRIGQLSGEAAREGVIPFLSLMAMISLNLAIFNLLPIPILDGGVILMLLIEMLIGRDLSLTFKEAVFKVGFVFLMAMVVFVLYNDITKVFTS